MKVEEVALKVINVPAERVRKEQHDPEPLAQSMKEIGQLQPIALTADHTLIFGLHRLEAAKLLGWETIRAEIRDLDALDARLAEIDENLRHNSLTVWEQGKHVAEREKILSARGERAAAHRPEKGALAAPLTTDALAEDAGMKKRTYQQRHKIGKSLGPQTTAVLDHADVTDDKQRNLLNSTTQLDHLANIANKHGDELAAEVAEKALSENGGNTFTAYKDIKGEDRAKPDSEQAWDRFSKLIKRLHELAAGVDAAGGIGQILRHQPEQNRRIFANDYRALAERALRQVEEFESGTFPQQEGGD